MDEDKRLVQASWWKGLPDCGDNWVLLWWTGPCSVYLYFSFLLMGGAVFPPFSLAWGLIMVGVMAVMATKK